MTRDDALRGRVAIVTGASKGIGRATVRMLAEHGADVVGVARSADDSADGTLGEQVEALGGRYVHVVGDVKEEATARQAVASAVDGFGRVDVLVNNAGVGYYADFTDCTVDDYDEIMTTNMRSTFLFTSAVVPLMKGQGSGLIMQVASQAGIRGFTREAIYCASKHAQVGFTRALRQELQPFGIKVGVVCPAGVATDFALGRGRTQDFVDNAGFLSPDDVAEALLFAALQGPRARVVEMGLISLDEAL